METQSDKIKMFLPTVFITIPFHSFGSALFVLSFKFHPNNGLVRGKSGTTKIRMESIY